MDKFQTNPPVNVIGAIERCKKIIRSRAQRSGLRYEESDIFAVEDSGLFVVWLRRFNPEAIRDDNGNESVQYSYPVYAEYTQKTGLLEATEYGFGYSLPVFRFPYPWLLFVVNHAGVITGQMSHNGLFEDGVMQ